MSKLFIRSGSLLLPVLCLNLFLPIITASSGLPLYVPIDHSQPHFTVAVTSTNSQGEPVSLLMGRLIRTHFGDQERWRPFLPNEITSTRYRFVRKHYSQSKLQISIHTIPNCGIECEPRHGGRTFYLRGSPFIASGVPASDMIRPTL